MFKVGDKVGFLKEQGTGIIKEITKGFYYVEDSDGFDRKFQLSELIEIKGIEHPFTNDGYEKLQSDLKVMTKTSTEKVKQFNSKNKILKNWEIDLHVEELNVDVYGMTNGEILQLQLKHLRQFHEKMSLKEIRKIVVIHGVGAGVLKEEIMLYFKNFYGTKCFDADEQEYGKGATEVHLFYE